jgi:HK97 family phage major capsid protein
MNAHTPVPHATFEQFVAAVVRGGLSGQFDDGLVREAAATGAFEGGGSAGGFLVPDDVAQQVWNRAYATGRLIARCDGLPVTRASGITLPAISETNRANGSRFGGVAMGWVDEAGFQAASKPKLDGLRLQLKKLLGVAYVTDELLADIPALATTLERLFSLEAAFSIEDKIVNGNGAGVPLGILNSGALITVDPEAGQATGSVLYQNLAKMVARLWSGSLPNAVWLMSMEVFGQVLQMTTADGAPIVSVDLAGVRRMLTIPIEVCEYTPAVGNAGDIVLCDLSQYLLAERAPGVDSSIHVQFVTDETAFRFRFRTDGQPAWRSPVTPKNSTVTVSPFIALAARP